MSSKRQRKVSSTDKDEANLHEEAVGADVLGLESEDVQVRKENDDDDETTPDPEMALLTKDILEAEAKGRESNKDTYKDPFSSNNVFETEDLTREQRYDQLMELLKQSQNYSKYISDSVKGKDNSSKLKNDMLAKRKQIKEAATEKKKRGGKRKQKGTDYMKMAAALEDYPGIIERKFEGQDMPDDQPLLLCGGIMRDYQLRGLQWMATLFETGTNGILADEMGLGKTIQTIALFCYLIEMECPGPFLIVAPLSTVPNWVNEVKRFAPLLPVVLYHGSKDERAKLRRRHLRTCYSIEGLNKEARNIFVTSYEIAMNDVQSLRSVDWTYIVVDEGHRLKNLHCKLLRCLKLYNCNNRLLLTGTPLQNNLKELWSLMNFIMPELFDDIRIFQSWFDPDLIQNDKDEKTRIIAQEKQDNILASLHVILKPFFLRRLKSDVDLKIPPKKEVIVFCPMSSKQHEMYKAVVNRTIDALTNTKGYDFAEEIKSNKYGRNKRKKLSIDYSVYLKDEGVTENELMKYINNIKKIDADQQSMHEQRMAQKANEKSRKERKDAEVNACLKNNLMDLRKSTNHPYLIEYPLTEDGLYYKSDQAMIGICGKLKVLDQMLVELMKRGHKTLIFSQMTRMLDILGDYLDVQEYHYCRLDGNMAYEDRQENIDRFNKDPDVKIFLLSTRAGGLGINLTAADTCIIYDSDWNPQQDLQAQDRCHRIGQTKAVMVYRLVTANTIDQKIVERAAAKRKLEKMIIHSKRFKNIEDSDVKQSMQPLTPQELLELLESKDHAGIVDRKDGVPFTSDELNLLLDRSDLTWAQLGKQSDALANKRRNVEPKRRSEVKKVFEVVETENKQLPQSIDK